MNKAFRGRRRTFWRNEGSEDYEYKFCIPIIFHNLRGYDAKHIFRFLNCRNVEEFDENRGEGSKENVKIIALNLERNVSFEMLYLQFIDLCQFLIASLASLVESLIKAFDQPYDKINNTKFYMGTNELLFAKSPFRYEQFDVLLRFNDTAQPPKEAFYGALTMESIADEEYSRAHHIWKSFKRKTFAGCLDLYLKTDVLQLSDCFKNCRELGVQNYFLDLVHYLTLP